MKQNLGYDNLSESVFRSITLDQLLSLIGSRSAVPVFFAFSTCPWCREYVGYLNEIAKDMGIDIIYYFNPREIKTYLYDSSIEDLILNEYFKKIIETIGNENVDQKSLCDIDSLHEVCDNKKVFSWIYVPILYVFQEGEVLGSYIGPLDHEIVDGVLPKMDSRQEEELKKNYYSLLSLI